MWKVCGASYMLQLRMFVSLETSWAWVHGL